MRLLLDTHVFLWLQDEPEKVSPSAREVCESGESELFLSVASIWEMQIKLSQGKLRLKWPLSRLVDEQCRENSLQILGVKLPHLWALGGLPLRHGDPFDRLLIAQANEEGMRLVSADRAFAGYPVNILW